MLRILKNIHGVEGIPLKLIIMVVILAITIPVIWKGLESYDRSQTENNLKNEIEFLASHIKQIYLSGTGNARDVKVDFKDGMMSKIEWIKLGDSVDGIWSALKYKLDYQDTRTIVISNPNIPIGNISDGDIGSLTLGPGKQTIHLECKEGFDFDNDGAQDMYIEVSKVV